MLITQLRLIMTTPTQMTPAKMTPEKADAGCNHALRVSLLDLKGPCIVCHEYVVHNGLAYLTGDLRCVPCQRAQLFRTVWPLNREFAEGWRQMFELAEVAHDYQAKQDETAGVPPDLSFFCKHILREMHQGAHNTHSTAVMTEASAQDSERHQMLACLADVISRFDANAEANDVGGGLAHHWRIFTTGLGPIWYVIDTSCRVDGHPRVEGWYESKEEAEDKIADLRAIYESDKDPFNNTYEIVVRNHPVGDGQLEWGEPFDIDDKHNMDADTA